MDDHRERVRKRRLTNNVTPPLPEPTAAMPGSKDKLEVMAWRETNGQRIHHPLDAQDTDIARGISAEFCLKMEQIGTGKRGRPRKEIDHE